AQAITQANPDVVSLEEINKTWLERLRASVGTAYPNFYAYPLDGNFGIGIFSKYPLRNVEVRVFGGVNLPSVMGTIDLAGKPITIVAVHTLPPMSEPMLQARNREIEGIIAQKQTLGDRFIIMGDFNCARWSPYFKDWLDGLNARDSSLG